MFRFSKKDGTRVQYIVRNVGVGNSNNAEYTKFQISARGLNKYDYATVFVWDLLPLKDGDKVEFIDIQAFDVKPYTYKGTSTFQITITATVQIVGTSIEQKPIEVEGQLVPNFAEQEMPF